MNSKTNLKASYTIVLKITVISPFGSIMEGKSMNYPYAHCDTNNMNKRSIWVSCNINAETPEPTTDQYESLVALCIHICSLYKIPSSRIVMHKQLVIQYFQVLKFLIEWII